MTCAMASTGPDASSRTMGLAAGGTTRVGVTDSRSTRCVVEPKKKRAAPVWPCVPSTMRVACESAAVFRISTWGSPTRTSSVAGCANAVRRDRRRKGGERLPALALDHVRVDGHRCRLHEERLDDVEQRQARQRPLPSGQAAPAHAAAWRTMSAEGGGKIHGAQYEWGMKHYQGPVMIQRPYRKSRTTPAEVSG